MDGIRSPQGTWQGKQEWKYRIRMQDHQVREVVGK